MSKADPSTPSSATPKATANVTDVAADREAATNLIRSQIHAIFNGGQANAAKPHAAQQSGQPPVAAPGATSPDTTQKTEVANPYHRTHTPQQQYDWSQYHTAWQQYYQQYYHRLYQQQLQTAKLQIGQTATLAANDDATPAGQPGKGSRHVSKWTQKLHLHKATPHINRVAAPVQSAIIKSDLLTKVRQRASRAHKSPHFWPAISGLLVVALFLFLQYNRVVVAEVKAYVSPGSGINAGDTILVDPTAAQTVSSEPRLIIPKLNLNVPVVYDEPSMEDAAIQKALERGVVRYNLAGANSLPGQTGNLVIGGHSSNDVFDSGGYKFAFLLIDRLQPGDIFYVHYQSTRYMYRVTEQKVIMPNELSALQVNPGKPIATLVTCTPTGTAEKRLLVFGEQISPDPAGAAVATQPTTTANTSPAGLPGNSPTLLERLGDLF